MFRGSIPSAVQQILTEVVWKWERTTIYVGCSGNFTAERALSSVGQFTIHSNDVLLYSSVIGSVLSGQSFRCDLKPVDSLEWLADYMNSPEDRAATVMLASDLTATIGSKGDEKANEYYQRLRTAYKKAFSSMHAKTVDRIKTCGLKLASFYCGDVMAWMEETVPADAPFISYPPFSNGAAKAFVNDFKKLNYLFDWDEPVYPLLDNDRLKTYFDKVIDRPHWLLGINERLPILEPYLSGMARTTNRGVPIYVYHSKGPKRIVVPRQEITDLTIERLKPGQEIGNKLTIAPLTTQQFQAARSQYMNVGIRPGNATLPMGVMVDGYLVGCYAFSSSPHPGQTSNLTSIYLLSDFPVEPTDYPRLSKLVLYAALSKESKLLAERITRHRIRSAFTTAFSNNPVSMKYRGLWKLYSRKSNPTEHEKWGQGIDRSINEYYDRKYQLNYSAEMGAWNLEEGLALWKKKHGQRTVANANSNDQD
jgi:hypothetical protein